jgi:hypothetical protein
MFCIIVYAYIISKFYKKAIAQFKNSAKNIENNFQSSKISTIYAFPEKLRCWGLMQSHC